MKFRKLRIAWPVVMSIACVLLIALWVRSYWRRDVLEGTIWYHDFAVESAEGHLAASYYFLNPAFSTTPLSSNSYGPKSKSFATRLNPKILAKDWALALLFTFMAVVPWTAREHRIMRRFSLRTLLVATTLLAVGLELIVAVLRWPAG